jgi:SAM-dependent methyltransferase
MTPEEAVRLVSKQFPFEEYMTSGIAVKGAYLNIANTVLRYLQPGSRVLDFGCGPCDKTSILQFLGFQCSGYDDLQDDWHKIPGNREKILSFAKECGVDFRLASGGELPFEKNSFDMIMLHDVLEHLHDSPKDLLNDLLELAKPEGLLFVTVPNAVNIRKRIDVWFGSTNLPPFESYYWYPGSWRGHIREYVRDDLVKLSEYLNLEALELRSCDHMLHKLPAAGRPAYLFVTTIFTGWKDSWSLVARKRRGWVPRKTLLQDELARILRKSSRFRYPTLSGD